MGTGSDWLRKLVEVSTGFFVGIEDKQKQEIITYYIHKYFLSYMAMVCIILGKNDIVGESFLFRLTVFQRFAIPLTITTLYF